MHEIQIRAARLSDLDAIVALNQGLFNEDGGQRDPFTNISWPSQEGHDYFTRHIHSDASVCLVAEVDDHPVGYLVGYTKAHSSVRPVSMAELESMFVQPGMRSLGAGEQLVRAFIAWCDSREVERIAVSAYVANAGALRFYERLGFVPRSLILERGI